MAVTSQGSFAREANELRDAHASEVQAAERLRALLQQAEAAKGQAERGSGR